MIWVKSNSTSNWILKWGMLVQYQILMFLKTYEKVAWLDIETLSEIQDVSFTFSMNK